MSNDSQKKYELLYFNYWNNSPLISIHVPTYKKQFNNIGYNFTVNVAVLAYLQTFDNWELRLIDNHEGDLDLHCLFDRVENILNRNVDKTKILYCRSDNDHIGNKRNQLIEATTAPIICNWDDDDLYLPEYLSIICKFYRDNPYRVGIIVGRRWQYNLLKQQRLIWSRNICNGAAYYVLRTDVLKHFYNIRYSNNFSKGEEIAFLREVTRCIKDIEVNGDTQLYPPIDDEYIRIRFGGNVTDRGGWANDIRIMNEKGGQLLDDLDYKWLFEKIPVPLHGVYNKLIQREPNEN
jgi:hypothetical protein